MTQMTSDARQIFSLQGLGDGNDGLMPDDLGLIIHIARCPRQDETLHSVQKTERTRATRMQLANVDWLEVPPNRDVSGYGERTLKNLNPNCFGKQEWKRRGFDSRTDPFNCDRKCRS